MIMGPDLTIEAKEQIELYHKEDLDPRLASDWSDTLESMISSRDLQDNPELL